MSAAKPASQSESVLRKLRKAHGKYRPLPPLEQLVLAVLEEGSSEGDASSALRALKHCCVDWNETRVARIPELSRCLGSLPDPEERARRVRDLLNRLFDLRGSVDLSFLRERKPAEARRALLELDSDMQRPVISMILFELCPGATIPLSPGALRAARRYNLVSRVGTKKQLQKVLEEDLSPEDAARLVQHLEYEAAREAEGSRRSSKTSTSKKKTKKTKTSKKKQTKKSKRKTKRTS